ncbi:MAG: ABC transporter permease [Candidatus Bathyarchaeia archaeon]
MPAGEDPSPAGNYMGRFFLKRTCSAFLTVLCVIVVTFLAANIIPGDPARLAAGVQARPEQIEALRKRYGLDQPVLSQFLHYMHNLFKGDLGFSIRTKRPIIYDVFEYLPATLELVFFSLFLTAIIGILLGLLAAYKQSSWVDRFFQIGAAFGISVPPFWLALLLQMVAIRIYPKFPITGRLSFGILPPKRLTGFYILDSLILGNFATAADAFIHIILPAVALSAGNITVIARMTRSVVIDILDCDYIRTARAKGISELRVLFCHALKNASPVILTSLALQTGATLVGAVPVEYVYAYPGIGLYLVHAILFVDYRAVVSVTLIIAILYSVINLLTDLGYALLDPRISLA